MYPPTDSINIIYPLTIPLTSLILENTVVVGILIWIELSRSALEKFPKTKYVLPTLRYLDSSKLPEPLSTAGV